MLVRDDNQMHEGSSKHGLCDFYSVMTSAISTLLALAMACILALPAHASVLASGDNEQGSSSSLAQDSEGAGKKSEVAPNESAACAANPNPSSGSSAKGDKMLTEKAEGSKGSNEAASPQGDIDKNAESEACASMATKKQELLDSLDQASKRMDAFRTRRNGSGIERYQDEDLCSKEQAKREKLVDLQLRQQEMLATIKDMNQELVDIDKSAAHALVTGELTAADIEERNEILRRLLRMRYEQSAQNYREQRILQKEIALENERVENLRRDVESAIAPVNEIAYEIESSCSMVRMRMKEARELIDGIALSSPLVDVTKTDLANVLSSKLDELTRIEGELGRWYDWIDAIAGASGSISYGAGIEFTLDEDEFVDKWGGAIDAFYDDYSKTEGPVALQGYGCVIAASAYSHRIDPRLCAAVSIAESSGGKHCIRSCNAWGWGAADSNPYELAFEWESFEESIEAWHEGMATSRTGLATAPTLSSLASIYCSSPRWGATVAEHMKQVSQHLARAS